MDRDIIITIRSVLVFLGVLASAYVFYHLRSIFLLLFLALLLVISIEPLVRYFSRLTLLNRPVSRGIAVLISYAILILSVVLAFTTAVPMVLSQSQKLIENFSFFLSGLAIGGRSLFESLSFIDVLAKMATTDNVSSLLVNSFSVISRVFTLLVLSIYMSLDWENLKVRFINLFSKKIRAEASATVLDIETHIGSWIKGQLSVMFMVGFISYLSLVVIGVNYALALGFLAAVLEIVPILGPTFSTVVASAVAFSVSPTRGLFTLGAFILIQQVESNLITPRVMQRQSGFSPLIILIAIMMGHEFFGVLGIILAVPTAMIIGVLFKRFVHYGSK